MHIIPKDFTLDGLLNDRNEQFRIPSYQRRYAWRYGQQAALFRDIDMLLQGEGHLFGMLILHTEAHHGGINTVDVVDGQQRLTTITILLKVLKDAFKYNKDEFNASEILRMLYCGNPKDEIPKLILGELDNPDMINLFKDKSEKIKNPRILEAYQTFKVFVDEGISENGITWLTSFYEKLTQTAKIIRLDVTHSQDAFKLFETINNRGLRLSATDILKNFILGHAAKIGSNKLKAVKELWAELITTLDGIPSDDFFRQYVSSIYTRKITKSKLIEEFKDHYFKKVQEVEKLGEYTYNIDYYEDEFNEESEDFEENQTNIKGKIVSEEKNEVKRVDIEEFLQGIVNAACCYSKIWKKTFENESLNKKLNDLSDIKCFPSYIFLMHYLQLNRPIHEVSDVCDLIASLMLRRHICARRTSENDDIFAKLLRIEVGDNYLEELKYAVLEDFPDDIEFLDRFPSHELKGNLVARAKYILREIEYFNTGNTGELTVNSGDEVHLEHIIPQKISPKNWKKKYGDWETYLGEEAVSQHRKYVNKIGNMTLLAGELNISASNNPFEMKRPCYQKSNISMTKILGNVYSNFRFEQLQIRGRELAEIALNIWKI